MASIVDGLERLTTRLTTVGVAGATLTAGCLLCLTSFLFGFGADVFDRTIVGVPEKEVGLLYAPNWLFVYMILFPPYVAFFSLILESTESFFVRSTQSPAQRVITGPGGVPVRIEAVRAAWKSNARLLSVTLYVLLAAVIYSSIGQWIRGCLWPYQRLQDLSRRHAPLDISFILGGDGGEVIDWSTLPYVSSASGVPSAGTALGFSALAYLYMGLALFIYLAILAYW